MAKFRLSLFEMGGGGGGVPLFCCEKQAKCTEWEDLKPPQWEVLEKVNRVQASLHNEGKVAAKNTKLKKKRHSVDCFEAVECLPSMCISRRAGTQPGVCACVSVHVGVYVCVCVCVREHACGCVCVCVLVCVSPRCL